MSRVAAAAVAASVVAVLVTGFLLVNHSSDQASTFPEVTRPPLQTLPSASALAPDTSQGLGCIHGGTTREEVRAVMGEPDSVAFGDWIYGRSSVTFGYGVVLDYSNAGGNLVICP